METDGLSAADFEHLYIRYVEKMYGVAFRLLHDEDACREIVQRIFLSLWERRAALRWEGPPEHYLMRATKLKVMEYIRNAAIERRCLQDAAASYANGGHTPENHGDYRLLKGRVSELVELLPTQCQTVYRMSREQGLDNRQISSVMSISEKTVEAHLSKALKYLRSRLAEYGPSN